MSGPSLLNVCFHGIGTPQRELEPGEDAYWVGADRFLSILDEIATWPSVQISFDDANASDAQIALPALVERGLKAQFFLLAGRLGTPGSLSVDNVHELKRNGMTIGTHGMFHRPWPKMSQAAREAELVDARRQLQDTAGVPVTDAACPLGRYDRRLLSDLRQLGYRRVYTSDQRQARRDSWLQPRFSIRREDTPESSRAAILSPPSLPSQVRQGVVGVVKRWR